MQKSGGGGIIGSALCSVWKPSNKNSSFGFQISPLFIKMHQLEQFYAWLLNLEMNQIIFNRTHWERDMTGMKHIDCNSALGFQASRGGSTGPTPPDLNRPVQSRADTECHRQACPRLCPTAVHFLPSCLRAPEMRKAEVLECFTAGGVSSVRPPGLHYIKKRKNKKIRHKRFLTNQCGYSRDL